PDGPAARPGAGRDHRGQLRHRPAGIRALADRAAGGGAGAGLPRRSAFQRAGLFAQLPVDARAPAARIRAPDRRQCRNRQGGEDLQPAPLPGGPLPDAGAEVLPGQPCARAPARVLGTLLAALGTLGYYVAYAYIAWRTVRGD